MTGARQYSIGEDLWARLPVSPDAYPQKIDLVSRRVLIIRLDASAYRSASFLDDRILGPGVEGAWLPGDRVADAARRVTGSRPLHFIFHTGHVGSTLVSRLLDDTREVLPLREPLPFRTLADAFDVLAEPESLLSDAQFEAWLGMMTGLWARGYDWTRAVIVKATSSAGRAAIPVLNFRPESRAIYMNVRLEPYLATLLAGQNSAIDLRGHGPGRLRRLRTLCAAPITPLHRLSIGELAALSWLVETAAQQDALRHFPERVIAVDFDAFLAAVAEGMDRILAHFCLPREAGFLASAASSPTLGRYSKAPEQAFSPATRSQQLRESRRQHAAELHKGRSWLERMARQDAAVAAIIATAGEG